MGYVSNANGLRLAIVKGWYNKINLNQFVPDNSTVLTVKAFNTLSKRVFEERRYPRIQKRRKSTKKIFRKHYAIKAKPFQFLTNKPKLFQTGSDLNFETIYLDFFINQSAVYSEAINLADQRLDFQTAKPKRSARLKFLLHQLKISDFQRTFPTSSLKLRHYLKNRLFLNKIKRKKPKKKLNLVKLKKGKKSIKGLYKLYRSNFRKTYFTLLSKGSKLFNGIVPDSQAFLMADRFDFTGRWNQLMPFAKFEESDSLDIVSMLYKIKAPQYTKLIMRSKKKRLLLNNNFNYYMTPVQYPLAEAPFLTHFYMKKLSRDYSVFNLNKAIKTEYKKLEYVRGLKLRASGRFTKRQRATFEKGQVGRIPLNTLSIPISYDVKSIPLKYGASTVKIWIGDKFKVFQQPYKFLQI